MPLVINMGIDRPQSAELVFKSQPGDCRTHFRWSEPDAKFALVRVEYDRKANQLLPVQADPAPAHPESLPRYIRAHGGWMNLVQKAGLYLGCYSIEGAGYKRGYYLLLPIHK